MQGGGERSRLLSSSLPLRTLACSAVQYLSFLFAGGGVNVVDEGVGGGDGDGALHGRWRG